ncbi:MAG: hypothetical protein LJE70_17705 [Chromatiaceae bacterium]|nr:hypothetical protein [Chromatiaceae bacterium]
MNTRLLTFVCFFGLQAATACAESPDLKQRILRNETAHIPSQCYTKTKDDGGGVHNPCYACHTKSHRPNYVNDGDLQLAHSFPLAAENNPWTNLFKDRSAAVTAIGDAEILAYIRHSNYFDSEGRIAPAQRLAADPSAWDYDSDGKWEGFVPDAWLEFDEEGFDRSPSGEPTGWRAFAYYPFPGTFWPTNGSTDDVLIRLAEPFRRDPSGKLDLTVYKTNLAIVEAMIREADVPIPAVDEAVLGGVDLDKDGRIATAKLVKYDWAPLENRHMWYVGKALAAQRDGEVHLAAGLYPEGTEFMHTVRYIDPDPTGNNRLSARIKEVRYARKRYWMTYSRLESRAAAEFKEKHDFPDRLRVVRGNMETGVSNDQGWVYAAMIEDAEGELRPQTYEELAFCIGCHSGIGATTDSSFAFARKLQAGNGIRDGWYHWSQKDLRGLPERVRSDGKPEYAFYLRSNGAGDELRENTEARRRFFDSAGQLDGEMLKRLNRDITTLVYASPQRALQLAKAYRIIVREQSFTEGRDPTIKPARNVHRAIDGGTATGVVEPLTGF